MALTAAWQLRVALLVAAAGAVGCVAQPPYKCTGNDQCVKSDGTQGICETTGACAFEDATCPVTRRRYSDGAGALDHTCVSAEPSCVQQLGVGAEHACAVRSTDGAIFCWGNNHFGEVGNGDTVPGVATTPLPVPIPTKVVGLPKKAKMVSSGEGITCAILEDSTVWCWGDNNTKALGQCGTAPTFSSTPVQVMTFAIDVNNVITCNNQKPFQASWLEVGGKHACALGLDGNVYCWGENLHGQCGYARSVADDVPGPLPVKGIDGITAVQCGDDYSCATNDTGLVYCWGSNALGSLGTGGPMTDSPTPVNPQGIISALKDPADLALDDETACVLQQGGILYCWGASDIGIFGAPEMFTTPVMTPLRVTTADAAFAGSRAKHLCVRDVLGNFKCWGVNNRRQTGTGLLDATVNAPTSAMLITVDSAGLGEEHTCALTLDGIIWCWGDNAQGELGIGTTSQDPVPVPQRVMSFCAFP